jgi:molybdopterin converting factor subunit 1
MTIRVRLFAGLQGLVGSRDLEIALPAGATVGALRDHLVQEYPVLDAFMNTLVCAVDEEMQPLERVLRDGDLVDVIPPIAGGAR